MKGYFKALAFAAALLLAGPVTAQSAKDLAFEGYSHAQEGDDRVFTLHVRNTSSLPTTVRGRFLTINVYDTAPPQTTILSDLTIPAGQLQDVVVRWTDAPSYGYMRGLLILTDGDAYLTEAFDLWILPYRALAATGIALVLILVFVIVKVRLSGRLRRGPVFKKLPRAPSGMVAHVVDFGDTVVSLANNFGGTWQDIVKANRLHPPYTLKPGSTILIPKHDLRRPEEPMKG
jgi:hypothetical protein